MRAADRPEEKDALTERFNKAIEDSISRGSEQALRKFDNEMSRSCAVVNVDLDFLHRFVTDSSAIYSTYDLSVEGQTRKPAQERNDRHRRTIEAMMFGLYAKEIRYAALSLDGAGLKSYGPYAMKLQDVAIRHRATLLEDNSYHFIPKHEIDPGEDIPPGYISTWGERHKLAVAKLASRISASTTEQEYSKILLVSTGDRATDEFIEVHIYGGFDHRALESVRGSSSAEGTYESAALSKVKDYLENAGIAWEEE